MRPKSFCLSSAGLAVGQHWKRQPPPRRPCTFSNPWVTPPTATPRQPSGYLNSGHGPCPKCEACPYCARDVQQLSLSTVLCHSKVLNNQQHIAQRKKLHSRSLKGKNRDVQKRLKLLKNMQTAGASFGSVTSQRASMPAFCAQVPNCARKRKSQKDPGAEFVQLKVQEIMATYERSIPNLVTSCHKPNSPVYNQSGFSRATTALCNL